MKMLTCGLIQLHQLGSRTVSYIYRKNRILGQTPIENCAEYKARFLEIFKLLFLVSHPKSKIVPEIFNLCYLIFSENMSVVTPGLAPTSGMANDTVNKLLDFSQKLDIGLLVSSFYLHF